MLDIKKFLKNDGDLLADVRDNLEIFMSVSIDDISGTICWSNGVDFDPEVLYQQSVDVDTMLDVI